MCNVIHLFYKISKEAAQLTVSFKKLTAMNSFSWQKTQQ
jgi:hypothetical protein